MSTADPSTTPTRLVVLWSKHRVEALTDGIFAVAMTLLVIDLKVPDPHAIHTAQELDQALADLAPKLMSWLISFFVLATFWIAHHRLFHYVRSVDKGLLWRNIYQLAFVSLLPFSAALIGEFPTMTTAQIIYNGNMLVLGVLGLRKVQYLHGHPELENHPLEAGTYHSMLIRQGGLLFAAVAAIVLTVWLQASAATLCYLSMIAFGRYATRLETKARARSADLSAGAIHEAHSNEHP